MDSEESLNGAQYSKYESEELSEAEKTPMLNSATGQRYNYSRSRRRDTGLWVAVAVILLLLTANATLLSLWLWRDLDATCVKHTSAVWSPIMDDVKLSYQPVTFTGNPFVTSPYMRDAGPEVDQDWVDLGIDFKYTTIVPEDRGPEAGMDPSGIKVNASYGGGYITSVSVLHQLHCLNMIRQVLPWNYDYYHDRRLGVFNKLDRFVRHHVDHCVDMIRQQIQCDSDVGMIAARWVQPEGKAINFMPTFSTTQMCRNFDDVLEWVNDHQRDEALTPAVREGDIILSDPADVGP